MDSSLFQFVNGLIGHSVWLDRFMYLCADGLPFVFALVLAGLWLTWRHKQQLGAFLALVSAFSALGVAQNYHPIFLSTLVKTPHFRATMPHLPLLSLRWFGGAIDT